MEANIDTEQLISLVQERPALWDKSREEYKSRTRTTECWREVCVKLNPAFESLSEADKNKYDIYITLTGKHKPVRLDIANIGDYRKESNRKKVTRVHLCFDSGSFSSPLTIAFQNVELENTVGSLCSTSKLIINKWKNVKDQYIKSVKKRKGKSGSAAKTVKNYIFHEQLSFLKVNMDMRETESSFEVDSEKSPGGLDEEREDSDVLEKASEVGEASATKMSVRNAPKKKKVDIEREILEHLAAEENRHISFFKGLLPSLEGFTDDEILQFQSGVIGLIQNLKKTRSLQVHDLPQNQTYILPQRAPYTSHPPPYWNNPSSSGLQRTEHSSPYMHGSHVQPPPTCSTSVSPVSSEVSELGSPCDANFAYKYTTLPWTTLYLMSYVTFNNVFT
ncbi:uncharacterized protein LOC125044891 [Penaeus chinensis]|uniref:uncharacterized protein LOC125044891 n=1 Tax=Penaeus chinensis TaxID=139456 RepID=UPI001FB84A74|nr:uncharacterized protein LOC125044891 [Penaeus chinensis]